MDWTSIIVALITGAASFLAVYLSNRKSAHENAALVNYRMDLAEKAQKEIADETSKLAERSGDIEKTVAIHDEQIKTVNKRVTALESKLS